MLYRFPPFLLGVLLGASFLLTGCSQGQPPAEPPAGPAHPAQRATAAPDTVAVEPLPEFYEGGGEEAVRAAVQQGIVLPWGTPVPPTTSRVVVRFVVGPTGGVSEEAIVQGLSPAVDEAVLTAVRALPLFRAVPRAGKYEPVPYTLTLEGPGVATPAQRREATTRWQRTARRLPGEADSTFVRRVLPLSYPTYAHSLLAYAWRPGAYGPQLFFDRRGGEDNDGGTDLFVLDPYQPDTYAVLVLPIGTMGDLTTLAALFFADATHDGQPELLALAECSLREGFEVDGEILMGRKNHYQTTIWQHAGVDQAGRPHYQADTTARPYLDDLPTAAEVRWVLTRPASAK